MSAASRSSIRPGTVVLALVAVLCVLSVEVRWYLTRELPFVMDELVDTQLAVQVSRGARLYVDRPFERMPLMTLLLAGLHDSANGSFDSVVASRKIFWFAMLLTGAGVLLVGRRFGGWESGTVALGLLLGFSSFLERSIRVRADALSTAFSVPALLVLTAPRLGFPSLAGAGFALGMAWITTQKAVYFVAAFSVALIARHVREARVDENGGPLSSRWRIGLLASRAGAAAGGFGLPFAGIIVWAHLAGALRPFLEQTLLYGAYVGLASEAYSHTWRYLGQTLARNPAFWGLGLAGMGWLFARAGRPSPVEGPEWFTGSRSWRPGPCLALACWTAVMVVAILQHTAKFPYVFLNVAPALAVCGAAALRRSRHWLWGESAPGWRRVTAAAGVLVLLILFPTAHHARALGQDLILKQKAVMERVDVLTEPDDAVLDGIGMAVTRRKATPYSMTARWHAERRRGAPHAVIEHLLRTRPKVAIRNYRLRYLTDRERTFIATHFVPDWANVAVVGAAVEHHGPEPTEARVNLLSATRYEVIARYPKTVTLDGVRVGLTGARFPLTAGAHTLRIEGAPQIVTLRYARSLEVKPPPPEAPVSLFPSYSW